MPSYYLRSTFRRLDGRHGPAFHGEVISADDDRAAVAVAERHENCPPHMHRLAAMLTTAAGAVIWTAKGLAVGERTRWVSRLEPLEG